MPPIKILALSTLYPNREMPFHGTFVETRLRQLVQSHEAAGLAVAPVPWFPWQGRIFGSYAAFARVPSEEKRHGITVLHPRYLLVPKLGMNVAPYLMYASLRSYIGRVCRNRFAFDVIDAHYVYPDGVAAVLLGRDLGRPVVITARGTDINLISGYRVPRRWIRWAAERAAGIVAVSEALRARLIEVGVPGTRIEVLRNGVDLELFAPRNRHAARQELGLAPDGPVLASVGWLIPRKGHELAIEAASRLPAATLLIAGEGPEESALRRLAARVGMAGRVHFLGSLSQERLADVYNAADALVLASSREGLPNVVLEALACGTPAVATAVWGTPEAIASRVAGRLVEQRTPEALGAAIRELLADPPPRAAVRAYAERFGWGPTTAGQIQMFRRILARSPDPAVRRP